MNLPEYLRHSRERRGYTLNDLAEMTKISVSFLSDLEHAVPIRR